MTYTDLSDEGLIGEGYDLVYGSEASDEEKEELVAWMDEAGRRWAPQAWEWPEETRGSPWLPRFARPS